MQVAIHGMDEPERRIDGIVFRLFVHIGESIRNHALGQLRGIGLDYLPCDLIATCHQAESRQGDEGVPSPICKPWIAGNHRLSISSSRRIRTRGGPESAGQWVVHRHGFLHRFTTVMLLSL